VALGVVTSIVFVPTFQKFTEDAFVQRVVAPTVREEIKKSFAVIKTENDAQAKAFFDLEHERFEKFAQQYRKQIESLKGDKVRLAEESQRTFTAYNEAKKNAYEWESFARNLEAENAKLKKKSGPFGCGVVGSTASGAAPIALFLSPLALTLFARMRRRKRT
jgi:MYXO-CTERM domain-containing protein